VNLEQLVLQAVKLYSLPEIVLELNRAIRSKNASIDELAHIVKLDPALASKVLKLANSPLFNVSATIDTIEKSVQLIGTQELSNLAMAAAVTDTFAGIDPQLIDMNRFWQLSIHAGFCAKHIAKVNSVRNTDFFFVSGLLHKIGLLALISVQPLLAKQVLEHRDSHIYPWYVEESLLNFTFAEIGAALLETWGLPENIVEMVSCQHNPETALNDHYAARIMHIATMMACAFDKELYQDNRFDYIAAIDEDTINSLGINLTDVTRYMREVAIEAQPVINILTGKAA